MNNSTLDLEAHRLTDGGLLLSIGGSSYTTYMKEQVNSYRITIGNQTCVLQKDNDPTIMRYLLSNIGKYVILLSCEAYFRNFFLALSVVLEVLSLVKSLFFLRSPSAGKLINYLVEDGGHVFAGDVFAEIEVMKMVMELRASENGWLEKYLYSLEMYKQHCLFTIIFSPLSFSNQSFTIFEVVCLF